MTKTVNDLMTEVRERIDEPTAVFWSSTELTRWINEAAREISRRAEVLQATTTVNSVAGTQEYTLSATILRVYRVEYEPTTGHRYPLEYRDFNSMDAVWWSQQTSTQGNPYWYTLWGYPPSLKLILYPTPSTSVTGGIKVHYYKLAEEKSGAQNLEVPDGWYDLIVDYCEYRALRKDGDPRWREAKALYDEKLAGLIELSRRWTDQADGIQVAGGMIPRWIWDDGIW